MSKEVVFIEKLNISNEDKEIIKKFLVSIFEDEGKIFKSMINDKKAVIKGKSFTLIDHDEFNRTYKIMGNCIGPVLYVCDIIYK